MRSTLTGRGFPGSSTARGSMPWSACPRIVCSTRICKGWPLGSSSTGPPIAMCARLVATSRCACLIRDVTSEETAAKVPRALVSTRRFSDGFAALQAFRPRWHIEDDTYRELKEGWGLEQQRWGRDVAAALGRTTLTCLAFNTAQVYRLQAGERLAAVAIRRLRRLRQRELGSAPAVIYLAGCYGVFSLEELLDVLGTAPRESLLPVLRTSPSSDAPT